MIVTALALELDAVAVFLANRRERVLPSGTTYLQGDFEGRLRWEVSVVETGAGNLHAAAETIRLIDSLAPDVIFFIGIAGGLKDVARGDVVVATKVYDLHSGKAGDDFSARPVALEPDYRMLQLARSVRRLDEWKDRIGTRHDEGSPSVFLGPIGASQQVITSEHSEIWRVVRAHYSDTLAVDMESAGFMRAIHSSDRPPALVVRGISDTGTDKASAADESWQPIAAARAAAFGFEVLARFQDPRRARDEKPVSNLPPAAGRFTGREPELSTMARKTSHGPPEIKVLHGLGGVGKTRLAIEYAERQRHHLRVAWLVRAEDRVSETTALAALASELQLPQAADSDQAIAAAAAIRWLENASDWLLIVEDAPGPDALVLPSSGDGLVLLTTQREGGWRSVGEPIRIGSLSRRDSIALLCERSGDEDARGASELAEALGDLPLALAQAAAYTDSLRITLGDYLERFRIRASALLEQDAPPDHDRALTATWELAFDQVAESVPARIVLMCSAFCSPAPIPRSIFLQAGVSNSPFSADDGLLKLDGAIRLLLRFSLVAADAAAVQMHRLVQQLLRERLPPDERERWLICCQILLEQSFPTDVETPLFWGECAALLPHARAATAFAREASLETDVTAALLFRVGRYLRARFELEAAEQTIQRAVDIKQSVEPDGLDVVAGLSELAGIQASRARLDAAERNLRAALTLLDKLGADRAMIAEHLANLGAILRRQKRVTDAVSVLEEALHNLESAYGETAPDLIPALTNLANACGDAGDADRAERLLARALRLAEAHLEQRDPAIAKVKANLGRQRAARGNAREGIRLQREALGHMEDLYGPDYPGLAQFLGGLGDSLMAMEPSARLAEAAECFDRASRLTADAQGPNHADVAHDLLQLARVQRKLGEDTVADDAVRRARVIVSDGGSSSREARVGLLVEFADTLRSVPMNLPDAEWAAREAIVLSGDVHGGDHPETAFALRTLGTVLREKGLAGRELAPMEESYRVQVEALQILRNAHGERAESVGDTLSNIGNLLGDVGETRGAVHALEEAVSILRDTVGPDAPRTRAVVMNLAIAYAANNQETEARVLLADMWGTEASEIRISIRRG